MGTNLLAARLKSLEAAGIVERTTLPAPAGVAAYALTPRGEGLRPALEELALWGFDLLPAPGRGGTLHASWVALTMAAVVRRAGGPGVEGVIELHVGEERFWLRCTPGDVLVRDGPAPLPADATVRMQPKAFIALSSGALSTSDPAIEVDGDEGLVAGLFTAFRLPAPSGV
jgi:hypothetical protein